MASDPDKLSDSDEILEAARRGDMRAWEQIIRECRPYLLAVAVRALEVDRPTGDCSSVVQGGLAKALQRIEQFRGHTRAELLGWLARIVSNLAVDRKQGRRLAPIPVGSDGGNLVADSGSTPSEQAARRERAARVLNAIDRLPPDYREVIYLRVFENLSYDDIATRMKRTNEAVRWLWVRALRELRDELGEEP